MKRFFTLLIAIGLLMNINAYSEEKENKKEKSIGVKFSGFVKSDFFFDSRQVVAAREGHFLLWPAAPLLDANGIDINDKSSFNFLNLQTRVKLALSGPEALGAKTSAVIEGDFFAQSNVNINLFRLRHAFIKLKWTNTELLLGQYWNPFFVTGCFPGTLSFNTGTPIQSFARNPQIRLTQSLGSQVKLIVAALAQRDFASRGPLGPTSRYLRNSGIPDMHAQLQYTYKNDNGLNILLGAGGSYKTIIPRLSTEIGGVRYSVNEKVSGSSAVAFSKLTLKPLTFKMQVRYGEAIEDMLSVSGYAEKNLENTLTGECTYTPLTNTSIWGEIHSNGKKFQVGVFAGYLKNNGTKDEMSSAGNAVYGFGNNIRSLYRISPRAIWTINNLKLAAEVEYTSASFGSNFDTNYIPADISTVANTRLELSVIYAF